MSAARGAAADTESTEAASAAVRRAPLFASAEAPPSPKPSSLLTLSSTQLEGMAGGQAGVRFLWRHLRRGDDPLALWDGDDADGASASAMAEAAGCGLGAARRAALKRSFSPLESIATVTHETRAADGTRKLLLRLADGFDVETVLIPPLPRAGGGRAAANARAKTTLCISSQVGCRQGCVFCATGRMGLLRNLTADEIVAQAYYAVRTVHASDGELPPLSNIV